MEKLQPGRRLGELLVEQRVTQRELAERIGATQPYVSQLIGGKAASLDQWSTIAGALGVPTSTLCGPPVETVTIEAGGVKVSGPLELAQRVIETSGLAGNAQAPADGGPEPGVLELERSAELRTAWNVTDDELRLLRAVRCEGRIRTAPQAIRLLDAVRLEDERTRGES